MDQRAQVPPSDRYFTLTGGHYLGAWWALVPTSYNLKIFIALRTRVNEKGFDVKRSIRKKKLIHAARIKS